MSKELNFIVSAQQDGIRLDKWLRSYDKNMQQSMIEKLLRKEQILIKGEDQKLLSSYRLKEGQEVILPKFLLDEIILLEENKENKLGAKGGINPISDFHRDLIQKSILFEDQALIILNKPYGLAVQGGTNQLYSIDKLIASFAGHDCGIVHRLDKDTTGLLLIGKGSQSKQSLTKSFKEREIDKEYLSIVCGKPAQSRGLIKDDSGGKTNYELLEKVGDYCLVKACPITGHKHQIRKHFLQEGFPILGDKKYDGHNAKRLFLHAASLRFQHPSNDEIISIKAPICDRENWLNLGFDQKYLP